MMQIDVSHFEVSNISTHFIPKSSCTKFTNSIRSLRKSSTQIHSPPVGSNLAEDSFFIIKIKNNHRKQIIHTKFITIRKK